MRFYDVNSGSITLDGVNINNLKKDDLRTYFGNGITRYMVI